MNKYLFILGLVGTALFTACSTADDLVADIPSTGLTEEENALIVEANKDSDVPITFGPIGSRQHALTRAPLDDNAFTIGGGALGVYCLAAGKQLGAPGTVPDDINWKDDPLATWLNNVPANINNTGASNTPIQGGDASYNYVEFRQFTPEKKAINRYYPFGNWYNYDFYAYYPRVAPSKTSYSDTGKACLAELPEDKLNGKMDIIWAHASSTDEIDGVKAYSSKYIRLKKVNGASDYEIAPTFEFNHLLSQFVFSIKPHEGDESELFSKGFAVSGLKFTGIPTKLQLVVASIEDSHKSGNFENLATPVLGDINVWDVNTDADPFDGGATIPVAESETDQDPKTVGYAMVPPSKTLNGTNLVNEHKIILEIKPTSGDAIQSEITLISPDDNGDSTADGFLSGRKYNITIEIYSPTKIQAKATLAGWASPVDLPPIPVY